MPAAPLRKPRVLLVCDRPGWAYDFVARQLMVRLEGRFDFELLHSSDNKAFDARSFDLVYLFWWHTRFEGETPAELGNIVREISSQRWMVDERFGKLDPAGFVETFVKGSRALVTTSQKLQGLFQGAHPLVLNYPLGVDPAVFNPGERRQESTLSIGWAGALGDPIKGLDDVLRPAAQGFKFKIAGGALSQDRMPWFYRGADVITVASEAEGTPLPLIEGMACGCFPVTTDVGVAREVIRHGENGLLVKRDPEAFRAAFEWCARNLDFIRHKGLENADLIGETRTWDQSAEHFGRVLEAAIQAN